MKSTKFALLALIALVFVLLSCQPLALPSEAPLSAATSTPEATLTSLPSSPTPIPPTQTPNPTPTTAIEMGGVVPEVIFYNGDIVTMNDAQPQAEAIALAGGVILAVGRDEQILAYGEANTARINLAGRALLPGFIDAHNHLFDQGSYWNPDLRKVQEIALENGLTTIADMYTDEALLKALQALAEEGALRIRTNLYLAYNTPCGEPLGNWYEAYSPSRISGEMLRAGDVKIFLDGGECGSPATSFEQPNLGQGDLWMEQKELNTLITELQMGGRQIAMHAMGDRALDEALKALEYALQGQPNLRRHRIEHNALIRDDQLSRYSQILPVVTIFGTYPACTPSKVVVPGEYANWEWRYRDLVDANPVVHIAYHSDAPYVGPLSPLLNLYSMVTDYAVDKDGQTICKTPAWLLARKLTVVQALRMMTIEAAYALFRNDDVGSLVAGKHADLVVLSANPLSVEPETIKDIQVLLTMVNGKAEFCRPEFKQTCEQIYLQVENPNNRSINR